MHIDNKQKEYREARKTSHKEDGKMEQSMVFFYCTYRKKGMANKAVTDKNYFCQSNCNRFGA